jgi:stearoyl-CoA desaturase (delta-9 desaturase)
LRTLFDGWLHPRTNQQHNALARDVAADPYYRFVSRPIPYMVGCALHVLIFFGPAYLLAEFTGIVIAWAMSVFVYNLGDSVNSLGHLCGQKPFNTTHHARNNAIIAYLALGEGWHANHHTFPSSARHGLLPHQWDGTYRIILLLEKLGLASSIRLPAFRVQALTYLLDNEQPKR